MDAGLLQYRKKANEIVTHLMAKDDERTAVSVSYTHLILSVYDLILIPKWVMEEIEDSTYRSTYVEQLQAQGYQMCIRDRCTDVRYRPYP